jgi:hypothetical protein
LGGGRATAPADLGRELGGSQASRDALPSRGGDPGAHPGVGTRNTWGDRVREEVSGQPAWVPHSGRKKEDRAALGTENGALGAGR